MLNARDQVRHLQRKLRAMPDLCLYYQQIGACESLRTDLIEAAFDRAYVDRKPLPRDAVAFEAGLESGRALSIETADALVAEAKIVLELHHRLRQQLISGRFAAWPAAVEDMDSQSVSYTHLRAHETDSYLVC